MRISTQENNLGGSLGFHQRGEGQKGTFSRVLPKRKHQPKDNVTKTLHKMERSHLIKERIQHLSSANFLHPTNQAKPIQRNSCKRHSCSPQTKTEQNARERAKG